VSSTNHNGSGDRRHEIRPYLIGLVVLWLILPLILMIIWAILHLIFGGFGGVKQGFDLWYHAAFYTGGPTFWAVVLIFSILSVIGTGGWLYEDLSEPVAKITAKISFGVSVLLVVFSVFQLVSTAWSNDKDVARFYDRSAVVYTPSLANAPGSLQYLLQGTKPGKDGCVLVSKADVPSCIKVGSLPLSGFDPRVSSAAGATIVMQRTSGTHQNVDLLTNTLTYLNGNGKNGVWSGIRDGSGSFQPTEGVVEWSGQGNPTECTFGGTDRFSMAINGTKRNSLVNYLANLYPSLYFQSSDIWGYCKGSSPVLVFPVEKQVTYQTNVLSAPAGVLIVTGSASGTPKVSYQATAANLPGPVYAKSVADAQRSALNWVAGRAAKDRGLFGFEAANSAAQAGNTSDYLLRSASDGHTYWVTPLTLTSSQSQVFVAFAMVRADEVKSGKLNSFTLYTLANTDPRGQVNVDNLEASARNYVGQQDPSFFSAGGKLIEFTPTTGDSWRAFGELNGRVVYRLDISATNSVAPVLVNLDSYQPSGSGSGSKPLGLSYCGGDPAGLTHTQVAACIKELAPYLSNS